MLKLAQIFGDHCVLQQQKPIRIFGTSTQTQPVEVSLYAAPDATGNRAVLDQVEVTTEDGRFMAVLSAQPAQENCMLCVTCGEEKISCGDVAIGEVWLAGGQSNMELELRTMKDGYDFLQKETDHNVRFYYTQKNSYMDDFFYTQESWSHWARFDAKESECWSAVGYLAARELADRLGVTVGVIGCNWGGTSASAWMSRKRLEQDVDLKSYVEEYDEAVKGLSEAEQVAAFDRYTEEYEAWNKECGRLYTERPDISWEEVNEILGPCQYPGPMNCKNPFRPAGLYECMIKRVAPYTLRGFWYYQGESDDHKPQMYEKLLTALIGQWRSDWSDEELFFINVQLPMHRWKQDPDFQNWPVIRQAQWKVSKTIAHTGLAVCIDCGEFNEIHPKDKRPVAHRLVLQTLWHVYQPENSEQYVREDECFSPEVLTCRQEENQMFIKLRFAAEGLMVRPQNIGSVTEDGEIFLEKSISGFEVSEDGETFVPADAWLLPDGIRVSALEITEPKQVRYLWTNYAEVHIYGRNGLPLAPFGV